jgi:putative flippase GtrA
LKKYGQLVRFVFIGGINTGIDFVVLFSLTNFGLQIWISNLISTTVALAFSFVANRSFTFKAGKDSARQLPRFLVVTLIGLWVIQPVVIVLVMNFTESLLTSNFSLFTAKVVATVASMTWNYFLYSKFVFLSKS